MARDACQKMRILKKNFYTIADLQKIFGMEKSSLLVTLNRLEKRGEITRLMKGVYQLAEAAIDIEKCATALYPSYISFESALAKYGVISQIPYSLTLATINRPKRIILAGQEVVYRRLKPELFFGYKIVEGVNIATPEKALLDQLYMVSKGRILVDIKELNVKTIDQRKIRGYVPKYPRKVQQLATAILA